MNPETLHQRISAWCRRWFLPTRYEVWAFAPGFGHKIQTFKTLEAAKDFKETVQSCSHIRNKFPGDYLAIVPRHWGSKTYSETL